MCEASERLPPPATASVTRERLRRSFTQRSKLSEAGTRPTPQQTIGTVCPGGGPGQEEGPRARQNVQEGPKMQTYRTER